MGRSRALRLLLAGGIADRERSASGDLLAYINPTFSGVRLAQRIPVRIRRQDAPARLQLTPGRTAAVYIDGAEKGATGPADLLPRLR